MSRPCDRECTLPALGGIDQAAGEFWVENPFMMTSSGHNLSAYERNKFFLNAGEGPFIDLSHASGADSDADSRGAIAADFDRDGAVDLLVVSSGGGPLKLFLNQTPQGNSLWIRLRGQASNASGLGTRITARVGGQTIHRDCFAHDGFSAQNPPEVHLGLGAAESIDLLTIRWPSGAVQTWENVPAAKEPFVIVEPEAPPVSPLAGSQAGGGAVENTDVGTLIAERVEGKATPDQPDGLSRCE